MAIKTIKGILGQVGQYLNTTDIANLPTLSYATAIDTSTNLNGARIGTSDEVYSLTEAYENQRIAAHALVSNATPSEQIIENWELVFWNLDTNTRYTAMPFRTEDIPTYNAKMFYFDLGTYNATPGRYLIELYYAGELRNTSEFRVLPEYIELDIDVTDNNYRTLYIVTGDALIDVTSVSDVDGTSFIESTATETQNSIHGAGTQTFQKLVFTPGAKGRLKFKANATYAYSGVYYIGITDRLESSQNNVYTGGPVKGLISWGEAPGMTFKLGTAFYVPFYIPKSWTSLMNMFRGCNWFNDPNISVWDVTNITNVFGLFYVAYKFNQPLLWNTENFTDTGYMFMYCSFQQDIRHFKMAKVTAATRMFDYGGPGTVQFNGDLRMWCMAGLTAEPSTPWDMAGHKPVWGTCPRGW